MVEALLGEKFPVDLHHYMQEPIIDVSADELRGLMKAVDMYLRFCYEMGYDYVPMITGLNFRRSQIALTDTASVSNWAGGVRYWQDESSGPIQNWKDFEAYPWPRAEEVSYAAIEYLNAVVPDGMKIAAARGPSSTTLRCSWACRPSPTPSTTSPTWWRPSASGWASS